MKASPARMQHQTDFVIPVDTRGYIPKFITKLWRFMYGSMQSVVHRVVYGNQANLGIDNHFFFDPLTKQWKSDVDPPVLPPALSPHVAHPYCIASGGIPKRFSAAKSGADVDLSSLAHPVYAPAGTMLSSATHNASKSSIDHGTTSSIVTRRNPFS